MSVLVEFSMSPLDKGASVGAYVARSLEIIEASGIDFETHAMGTILEGEWDECFDVIRRCHERMIADCARVTVSIKVDSRPGHDGRLAGKVEAMTAKLGRPLRRVSSDS